MSVFRQISIFLLGLILFGTNPSFADQEPETATPESQSIESASEDDAIKDKKKDKDPDRGRFLPIPIFITEPAIGEGFGLTLAYFHRSKDMPERDMASPMSMAGASSERKAPPTVTGVFGAYTNNETAVAGIGHMNSFMDDHIRFTGVIGLADINSTFYILDQPFKFNLNGAMAYQETRFRVKD